MKLEKLVEVFNRDRRHISAEEMMMLVQGALGVLAILPFGIWRVVQGSYLQALVDFSIVVGMLSFAIYGALKGRYRQVNVTFAIFYCVGMLVAVALQGEKMLLWAYPAAVAVFFVVRLREAMLISFFAIVIICFLLVGKVAGFYLCSFIVTYTLVCLFAYIFASRILQDNRRLTVEATIDPLTGAGNRRALAEAMEKVIADKSINPAMAVSLVLFDIDYFKSINDLYGHAIGDKFLMRFADFLRGMIRADEALYRFGGEEFVVLAKGDMGDASSLAHQVRDLLESTYLISDKQVTVSVGVAELAIGESARELMKRADDALYEAKTSGRNRVCQAVAFNAIAAGVTG